MKKLLEEIDHLQSEIDSYRPLDKHHLNQIREYYRIGLTFTSNAMEGNTLTESETKVVLEEGITIGGKSIIDHLEAIGLSDAYDFLLAQEEENTFSEEIIKRLHWLFYYRINRDQAGVYRDRKVYITGSKYPLPGPEKLQGLMDTWIVKTNQQRLELHPVVFAALAHKDFVFIHPFVDGNGRVARLLMNLILLQAGYTIALIPPIVRADYLASLERAHSDDTDFITLIAHMVKETQEDYVRLFCS